MLHYHGTPISPRSELETLSGRNFCVSFARPDNIKMCHRIGQSVLLDNGAFSVWRRGVTIDWQKWARWVEPWLYYPTTWAVLPDSIEGGEAENDALLARFSWLGKRQVAPVWHLHESLDRLRHLVANYERVCFGSSGAYSLVRSESWHARIAEAFDAVSDPVGRVPWLHMLRGMATVLDDIYPFASVDSTDVARNHNRPQNTALRLAERWDAIQAPPRWRRDKETP